MAMRAPAHRTQEKGRAEILVPDKLYFRIGEVARLCGVPAYVLRFWETEFPQLRPHKGGTGQRLYRKRDVELVLEIKHLLYDEKFTIPGARRALGEKRGNKAARQDGPMPEALPVPAPIQQVRGELREILNILDKGPATLQPAPPPAKRKPRHARKAAPDANAPMLF